MIAAALRILLAVGVAVWFVGFAIPREGGGDE